MLTNYLDFLALFGIGGAHPGGFALTESILEDEKIQSTDSVLDIGCGTGQTAAFVAQRFKCKVTAVDNHKIMIKKARERFQNNDLSVLVMEGDAQNVHLMDNSFDFIIAESVISFTAISETVNELSRLLKSGGRIVIIEMAAEQPITDELRKKVSDLYGINEILNEQEWIIKLQQAGFTQIERIDIPAGLMQLQIDDINQSENITMDLYDVWDEHHRFISENHEFIGFRAFRCQLP